ncbi:MAG: helix-turn-helix domain-containing protein [Planctomycetes bacterium]|nr:helix-turn-helix domain-containing protein [Planctomycetota bacterium]
MDVREVGPGKYFGAIVRPPGAAEAFPFHVRFRELHLVESRTQLFVVRAHRHDHFEFVLVDEGPYHCRINGELVAVATRSLVMLKPGDRHEDQCQGPVRLYALTLSVLPGSEPDRSADILAVGGPPEQQVIGDERGLFADIIRRIESAGSGSDPFSGGTMDALCCEFIWAVLRALPRAAIEPGLLAAFTRNAFGIELNRLFARHLHHHIGLSDMATELGMSERTLSARCRTELGASPTKLFVRHQMERAHVLLAQTDLPIAEISAHLGFENPYHFSTVYKRVHGVAPTKHRG